MRRKTEQQTEWWKGAVIYQIYPRSFLDTSGNGTGDLRGIEQKLDYVADLGVDAIWISPFVASPMLDFGYDVSDYLAVDPLFGTLDDFSQLLEAAHERGIKVLMDQVLSHTSDRHPWFIESREGRDNEKADWYVWADATETGGPPNNWLAVFGGSSWQWEPRRGQYYLHNFLRQQPDLNYHCPEVQDAVLDVCRFWLDLGVDGFRLDVCAFYFHDAKLRDNPPNPVKQQGAHFMFNPYSLQAHKYDIGRPENLAFLERLRALTDEYEDRVLLGELNQEEGEQLHKSYTAKDRLHIAYGYWLLGAETPSAAAFRDTARALGHDDMEGWPCWAIDNHDFTRSQSRFGLQDNPEAGPVLTAAITLLRGAACIYQGAELSLPEAEVPYDQIADPYGREFYPAYRGRDGARTPMPWAKDDPNAGFSKARPWLPMTQPHRDLAVEKQDREPGSPLNRTRTFINWRREQPQLLRGSMDFLDLPEPLLGIKRTLDGRSIIAILNLSDDEAIHECDETVCGQALSGHGFFAPHRDGRLEIPAFGAWFGVVE
ncbi:MAG: alpha-amylase family glycosyl hydrolase [Hoeflea sp.]|uniref:alpha-amylase family glycosyl hydrolase n=1 Tax=Hoeflea sp. TaxID=1940281 RepID=UPI0032EFA85B